MQASPFPAHVFSLTADSAPGLVARVLNPFAKRDVTPDSIAADRDGDIWQVRIVCHALDPVEARLIRADLLRLVGLRALDIAAGAVRLAA